MSRSPVDEAVKSGRYNRLRETAFDYSFLLWQFGVEKVP